DQVVHLLPVTVVDVERGRGEGEVPHLDAQDGGDDLLQNRPLERVDAGPAPDEVVAPNEDVHVELAETGLERDEVVAGDVLPRLRVDVRVVDLDHGATGERVLLEQVHHVVHLVEDGIPRRA